jgi:predicted ATP-dependent protease
MGRGGIVNIERESKLSGKTHDKGVLILAGYLGGKYAQQSPLSLSSSVCFEQSYDGVDGDSASSTELYAILSSLSEIPIAQGIAVTGSVNQNGEVQAIGGVNQKIEGHYDVCRLKGFNAKQGVMIPRANLRSLMLRPDVVEAVKAGKFHIYAVNTIDEGVEVLTGISAGERASDGSYAEGSVNHRVQKKLQQFTKQQQKISGGTDKESAVASSE